MECKTKLRAKNFEQENILNSRYFNPLIAELNPICHLLALLGAHHIFHVSGLRVNGVGGEGGLDVMGNAHNYTAYCHFSFRLYRLVYN